MKRFAQNLAFLAPAAVMSAWGVVMLHTIAAGHLNRLVSPMFRSYVLIAGVALIALSALYLFLYQPAPNPAPALAPTGRARQLLRWTVLLLPVLAASVFSPDALSSTTFANRAALNSTAGVTAMPSMSAASQEDVKSALAADPNQPVPVEVTDLVTLSHSPAQMQAFAGRKVRSVGFIIQQPGSTPKLLRWMMWCCAADAQPVSVQLGGKLDGAFKDTDWYEIVGNAQFPSTLGQVIPRIDVESVKPAPEPDEPYLSP
jgi:uncharacterized repeat protein (TIGR03943 family)